MPNSSWPLPLAAFEEYMLRDDRPKYPMSIIARLRFAGQLDRQATAEALETAVARHPLLRAKVCKTRTGRLKWIASPDRAAAISWIDGQEPDRLPSMQPIDLFSEPGLRSWGIADSQRARSCCKYITRLATAKRCSKSSTTFCEVMPTFPRASCPRWNCHPAIRRMLYGRGSFGLTVRKYLRMLPVQLLGLSRVLMFFMRRPVPLLKRIAAIPGAVANRFPGRRGGQPGSR